MRKMLAGLLAAVLLLSGCTAQAAGVRITPHGWKTYIFHRDARMDVFFQSQQEFFAAVVGALD